MIWIWINNFVASLKSLLIPPIPEPYLPVRDINAPCPCCGHRDGHMRAMVESGQMVCQHTCHVCGAVFNELPALRPLSGPALIRPEDKKIEEQKAS